MHSLEDVYLFLCIRENSQVDFFSPFSLPKFYKSVSQKKVYFVINSQFNSSENKLWVDWNIHYLGFELLECNNDAGRQEMG